MTAKEVKQRFVKHFYPSRKFVASAVTVDEVRATLKSRACHIPGIYLLSRTTGQDFWNAANLILDRLAAREDELKNS